MLLVAITGSTKRVKKVVLSVRKLNPKLCRGRYNAEYKICEPKIIGKFGVHCLGCVIVYCFTFVLSIFPLLSACHGESCRRGLIHLVLCVSSFL